MGWDAFPSNTIESDTCHYSGYITYTNIDKTLLNYIGPYPVIEKPDTYIYDDIPFTEIFTEYIFLEVFVDDRLTPYPGTGKVWVTCSSNLGEEIHEKVAYAVIGPISISYHGVICTVSAQYVDDPGDWDDVFVTLSLYIEGKKVKTTSFLLGNDLTDRLTYTWWIGDDGSGTQISPERVEELLDQATFQLSPVNPAISLLYYVGTYPDVVKTDDPETIQDTDVYIMLTSDLRDAYAAVNALTGHNIELIVVDRSSYKDYLSGKSTTFNAVTIHAMKQYVDVSVPGDSSQAYCSNGNVQIIEKTQNIGNYTVTTYEAIVTSQYHLDLSDIYGTSAAIDTPPLTTTIKFPNCTFTQVNWTDDGTVDLDFPVSNNTTSSTPSTPTSDISTSDISTPNIPTPNIPTPDTESSKTSTSSPTYTYKIDILRSLSDSYIWKCEKYADFTVIVYRSDGLRLSSSSFKVVSVATSPSLEYTITKLSDSYRIGIKLPQQDTTVHVAIAVEIDGKTYTQNWSFTVTEWGNRRLSGEVKTDKTYYDYGSSKPVEVTVTVRDINGKPINGLTITDNWNNTYTDHGDGTYKATIDISNLPTGQYNVFVKIDPGSYCYKSNLSDQFVVDKFVYNPLDFQNQNFKLTYPLVENVTVTINGNKTTNYSITLNEYGEGILYINDTLKEGDKVEVKYQAYTSSTTFNIGSSEPISSTVTNEESIAQYGQTPAVVITIPFLHSREEANEIAEMYLKYYSKPTKIISTNNKW